MTPRVLKQLAHELEVIERTGLAEFFLICWDLMRFSRERGIPAQGRGSAGDSIVAYVLGITRVDPIRHELLFERFINEGRTTYPDVDIDFASSRREEVIQYVYERYGAAHTGMVCNVVTYRARSAVREVGYALGFPRPLVDRVAKALETYDSVMVRRDLEADGGFAEFFAAPVEGGAGIARAARRHGRAAPPGSPDPVTGGPISSAEVRPGPTDDEGGPGDTPASARFLRQAPERRAALADLASPLRESLPSPAAALAGAPSRSSPSRSSASSPPAWARIELDPLPPRRRGSTLGLSPWERWLELCARIDGSAAAPLHPRRRHARDARPARGHRAARARHDARPGRRPVRQARRRDDEAHQARPARPAHALGHRRRPARHPGRLRRLPRPRPAAGGHPRGLRA